LKAVAAAHEAGRQHRRQRLQQHQKRAEGGGCAANAAQAAKSTVMAAASTVKGAVEGGRVAGKPASLMLAPRSGRDEHWHVRV